MNIYEKMSAITAEISSVAKNLNVGWGKSQYKAVGEADVLAAVKPIEAKYKVYSYPYARQIAESGVLVSTNRDGQEVRQNYIRIDTTYRFINIEKPEEYIDVTTYGDGVDSMDKAPGKAMTYGDKYALLKAYKIITGDDPDQNESQAMKSKGKTDLKPVTNSINTETKTAEKAANKSIDTETAEKAANKTINATEWSALKKAITNAGLIPADVIKRFGADPTKPSTITVGLQTEIIRSLPGLVSEQQEMDEEARKREEWREALG